MNEKFLPKKSLGQHFLTSRVVPEWMCDAAEITLGEKVVEIGPGMGVLTRVLLERGASVLALEADPRAVAVLEREFSEYLKSKQLEVRLTDIRTTPLDFLETYQSYKVVANIPYYLSGFLFRRFLTHVHQPSALVFLVQREVAKRVTVREHLKEKHSLLSLSVQAYGTTHYVKTVSRGHFAPPPKVDSGIVSVRNISCTRFEDCDETLFFSLLHLGFGQKRKQLIGNLSAQYMRETLEGVFNELKLPLTVRAEDLSLQEWLSLTQKLETHNSNDSA